MRKDKNFIITILILLFLGGILFYVDNLNLRSLEKINEKLRVEEEKRIEFEKIEKIKNILKNTLILAKAFSIYDISSEKEIYEKNENEILPLASLSKTMTVLVALETYQKDDNIKITEKTPENIPNGAPLAIGEEWKMEDLAKFTLLSSSNDGALGLSGGKKEFLFKMNGLSKEIGLNSTEFFNFTGLDIDSNKSGAYGSAKDMNMLAKYAIENYPEIFSITNLSEMSFNTKSGITRNAYNTNIMIWKIPNLIFSKTGFTTLAGGNLTIIFENKIGHKIAITLLGSTKEGRFADMEKLVEIAYNLN